MENKIVLLPGEPNDANRDYLPEAIKDAGSRMVVNENGNNSQPYPKNLQEFKGAVLEDGLEDTWYEYVPASYNPAKKTPLVVSAHGGLMTGWGQCIYTSWTYVADREGFICLFPNAHARRFWQIMCEDELKDALMSKNDAGIFLNDFPADIAENHDASMVLALIERMKQRYNIDETRIYMQGMSLGNAMTQMMAKYYSSHFAAMAGSAGPARRSLLFKDGKPDHCSLPVDAWQTRMELDGAPPACDENPIDIVAAGREYWLAINECERIPKISIFGENNFAFYSGKKADYIFRDVKNRDHGQTFDDAELVWDYMFSGASRSADGAVVHSETKLPKENDACAVAAVAGCTNAWVNGEIRPIDGEAFLWQKLKYHGLNGGQLVRGEYLMLPAAFLAEAIDAAFTQSDDGETAVIVTKSGKKMQFARGSIGAVVNNRIQSMLCEAVLKDGKLYISSEWFMREACGYQVSRCGEGMYATDHYTELSAHMTRLLRDLLK